MIQTGCFNRDYNGFSQQKSRAKSFSSRTRLFLKGIIVNPHPGTQFSTRSESIAYLTGTQFSTPLCPCFQGA